MECIRDPWDCICYFFVSGVGFHAHLFVCCREVTEKSVGEGVGKCWIEVLEKSVVEK